MGVGVGVVVDVDVGLGVHACVGGGVKGREGPIVFFMHESCQNRASCAF